LIFGFLLANDKCNWLPKRKVDWLGYSIDFELNKVFIQGCRIEKLEQSLKKTLDIVLKDKCRLIQARLLASVIGQIISLQFVLGRKFV
jgi:hypothetical protein